MPINFDKLDDSEIFIVKWQYRMLGDFGKALIEAIMRADDGNLEKLDLGFPDEVRGYIKYARLPGWWTMAKLKAGIED